MYGLLRLLKNRKQYNINIMAYEEGDLHKDYESLIGASNIEMLNGLPCTNEFRERIQNDYDLVLMNTAAVYPFSFFLMNTEVPVYWWLHEAPQMIEDSFPAFPNPHLLSSNFHLFLPSKGAARFFSEQYSYMASVLPVPVYEPSADKISLPVSLPDDKIIFFIPSAYTYIKGQDILLSAIEKLPENYRQQSYFVFCGYSLDKQTEYKELLMEMASKYENVLMLGELPVSDVYSLMNRCHCIIAPSRIDCLPTTIVEGSMFSKLLLVSILTGVSDYIQDCKNGFIFKDIDELIKRLLLIISDYTSLSNIALNGNRIYTDNFSPSAVDTICRNIGL